MTRVRLAVVVLAIAAGASCGRQEPQEPPLARVSLTLDHSQVPLGGLLELTYRFEVAANAPSVAEDYKVFVGFVDANEDLMWTDDHDPPVPTTQWKPGQIVEYTRTAFIPSYPYTGDASIHMGLYSVRSQKRVTLEGDDVGQQAYRVATLQLLPQSASVLVIREDGWHGPESPPNVTDLEWQWTKQAEATVVLKNPKAESVFYFDLDNPSDTFPQGQRVQVKIEDTVLDDFLLQPGRRVMRKIPLAAAQLGPRDTVELKIATDKTFVPASVPGSGNKDPRQLGVRVFHTYVGLKN